MTMGNITTVIFHKVLWDLTVKSFYTNRQTISDKIQIFHPNIEYFTFLTELTLDTNDIN